MAARPHAFSKHIVGGARDRRFAGGIDRRHDDCVGIVEAGTELREKRRQACIAMRLHDRDNLALGNAARGTQHRRLDRYSDEDG